MRKLFQRIIYSTIFLEILSIGIITLVLYCKLQTNILLAEETPNTGLNIDSIFYPASPESQSTPSYKNWQVWVAALIIFIIIGSHPPGYMPRPSGD